MPTPTTPREDVPTSAIPVPTPTHPVAGRAVTADAPAFDWTPVPDADTYRLQIAASDDFETIYYDKAVERPASLPLVDVLPDDARTVAWRVRAETGAEAPWSPVAHFDASASDTGGEESAFVVNAAPVPLHPVEGDAVDPDAAAFTWEVVPEASDYQVQVGRSASFDNPAVNLTFDQVTSLTLFDGLPGDAATLHWRVRTLFPNGAEGPWSTTAVFGTDTEAGAEPAATEDPSSPATAPSPKNSPVAAGPAQHAHTSKKMAMTFVLVLVVSFLLTILLIMWFL
jgi:hypothetical protein